MTALALLAALPAHAQLAKPGQAPAVGPDAPRPEPQAGQDGAAPADPAADAPILPSPEFEQSLPPLADSLDAPLEPIPAMEPPEPATSGAELAQPLPTLNAFDTTPLQTGVEVADADAPEIRYDVEVRGLEPLKLTGTFRSLSALEEGDGKAANATQVAARAREDEALAVRLMKSLGYYDATAISTIESVPAAGQATATEGAAAAPGRLRAIVSATPGRLYTLGTITVNAQPTIPADLLRRELPLRTGDPIEAARIQGAEANVSLKLPQQGYPFVKVGDRDILLDEATFRGDYTLPVDTGPRSSFGALRTEGDPVFDLEHLNVFPRFDAGDLYDSRMTDDLRDALVATSLFGSIAVEPVRTGEIAADGTERVDLLVRQTRGPARSLAAAAGYGTGEGVKLEGTWTHRNLFPPEGALIASVVAGTQEQGASGTFRRSNAGRRDRTVTAILSAARTDYDAFDALTATLSGRISYDSTPIWQKPLTYAYGFELVGTNESVYDFGIGDRRRGTYFIAALPGQILWDRSDDLLNPTRGFRVKLNVSPETSVRGAVRPYVRTMVEATGYFPVSDSLVIAGRARAGSIAGVDRDDLAPSRRYYGGGGGSVRGYGFQRLGPFDPQGNPVGGRSLNEFALEARYRFGDFGIVPFIDAGNAYEDVLPQGRDLRMGAGIGGRFYTNFGPMRVDIATPLNPRPGDGRIALYISIGQAF